MTTTTAAARRAQAGAAYRGRLAQCATHRVLDRLGDKWVSLVLRELAGGPRRHAALASALAAASQKMLTQTLRTLERDGLVTRSVTAAVPVRVDYALTPLGASLLPVLAAVTDWAEQHIDEVTGAQRAYDERVPGRTGD